MDYIIWAIVGFIILYAVIRIAVREGIIDALARAVKNGIFSQLETAIKNGNIEALGKVSKDGVNTNEDAGNSID